MVTLLPSARRGMLPRCARSRRPLKRRGSKTLKPVASSADIRVNVNLFFSTLRLCLFLLLHRLWLRELLWRRLLLLLLAFVVGLGVQIVKIFGSKEGVEERDGFDVVHVGIVDEVGIDDEVDRHVHPLLGRQQLLFEAEALDLLEVDAGLGRHDVVGRNAHDVIGRWILGAVEGERAFAWHQLHLVLERVEHPGDVGVGVAVELDGERPFGSLLPSIWRRHVALLDPPRRAAVAGHLAESLIERHRRVGDGDAAQDERGEDHAHVLVLLLPFLLAAALPSWRGVGTSDREEGRGGWKPTSATSKKRGRRPEAES